MISNDELGQIINYVQENIPHAEFINHGEDGVIFQVKKSILKVFPNHERAGNELSGFKAIETVSKDFCPKILSFGRLGQYAAILREDILDSGAHSDETENDFLNLRMVIAPEIARQIKSGQKAENIIEEQFSQFLDDRCIDEDSDIFTKKLLKFLVDMILNNIPIKDLHLDNLGFSRTKNSHLRVRDMSRFTAGKAVPILEEINITTA